MKPLNVLAFIVKFGMKQMEMRYESNVDKGVMCYKLVMLRLI